MRARNPANSCRFDGADYTQPGTRWRNSWPATIAHARTIDYSCGVKLLAFAAHRTLMQKAMQAMKKTNQPALVEHCTTI